MNKNNGKKIKMSREDKIFHIIGYTVYSILLIIFAYPFYHLLISTISDNDLVTMNQITLFPKGIHFENYLSVFKLDRMRTAALVSLAKTLLGTVCNVLVVSYVAYCFTKENMWQRKLAYRFVVATMYFGTGLIPVYMNIKMLGLMNSFWVYVIPHCFTTYNMVLVKTSMEALPPSLEESAEIDGAGYLVRFFKIVLPLSKPILATVALFTAVSQWNNIFDTKLYIVNHELYSLQFLLHEYYQRIQSIQDTIEGIGGGSEMTQIVSATSIRLTMTAVTVIPIMCVYPFIQKYYMKGMMLGAVKG